MPLFSKPPGSVTYEEVHNSLLIKENERYRQLVDELNNQTRQTLHDSQRITTRLSRAELEIEQLRNKTLLDELTHLRNQRALNQDKSEHIKYSLESGEPLHLIFADVRDFKHYNSEYGHHIGDEVMKSVGGVIYDNTKRRDEFSYRRGSDGADEAVIALRGGTYAMAKECMDRILEQASNLRISAKKIMPGSEPETIGVTLDVALATFTPLSYTGTTRPPQYCTDADWYTHLFDKTIKQAMHTVKHQKQQAKNSDVIVRDPVQESAYSSS